MSFNLVDLVKDQLTGQIKGHVSKMLGNESGKADAALGAAVPGLLKGFAQTASTPSGADSLLKAINGQDDSLLDNVGSMLGGDKAGSLLETGNKSLGSVFGDKGAGALLGAVSGVSGLSKGGTKSIMGLAAPMVMGVIKRKVMSGGLNASGLASMLKDQSQHIDKAMPAGFADQLNTQGFLGSVTGGAAAAAKSATSTAKGAANAASNFGGSNVEGSPIWKKLLPIAGILALLWIGLNLFGGKKDAAVDAVGSAGDAVTDGAAAVTEGAVEGVAAVEGVVADGAAAVEGVVADGAAAVADGASAAVEGATDLVADGAAAVADGASAAVEGATDLVADGAAAVTDGAAAVVDGAAGAVEGATDLVADGAAAVADGAAGAVEGATDLVADGAAAVADGAAGAVEGATDLVADGAAAVADGAAGAVEGATDLVADGAAAVADGAAGAVEGATDLVADGAAAVTDGAAAVVDGATDLVADGADAATDGAAAVVDGAADVATEGAEVVEGAVADTDAVEEVAVEGEAAATEEVAVDRSSFSLGAISRQFGGVFGTAGAVLGGVNDADSATAALPKLEELSGGLDGVIGSFDAVPESARGPLNKVVSAGVAKLTPLADTVLNKEGVGDVLGGVVGPMMDKLKGLVK